MLFTIDKYLDTAIVKIKEYDNRDAIGKYLLPGNPFFDEVSKISLWIANTYILCNSLIADIIENDKDVPSIEEVISSIPDPDFLTEEELVKFKELWISYDYSFQQEYMYNREIDYAN